MNNSKRVITVLSVVAVFAFASVALAGWGRGAARMGGGYGQGGGCPYGVAAQGYNNLSAEDMEKLNADRLAYYKETEDLRSSLYQKSLELRSELAKKDPDAEKAAALQGEISKLQGELSQKRLAYQLKAGVTASGAWCGFGGQGGRNGMRGNSQRGGGGCGRW